MTEPVLGIIVLALLAFVAWREREARVERERLTQRIQAPDQAVAAFARLQPKAKSKPAAQDGERGTGPRVLVSDDEAMAKLYREREGIDDGDAD